MPISQIHSFKFQKSKTFLFPAIGVRRNDHTASFITYLAWNNHYRKEDYRLTAVKYGGIDQLEYRQFESLYLLPNVMLEQKCYINENVVAYVFNYESYAADWDWFLKGKYSKLSDGLKEKIKQYYRVDSTEWEYVQTFLYPEKHFEEYAAILFDSSDYVGGLNTLKKIGELCNPFDPEAELFDVIPKMELVHTN